MVTLKNNFHVFADFLAAFLAHNGALIASRVQFSHQATDVEHLFDHFHQLASKHNGSMPALARNRQGACSSSIQQSGLPFLKGWQGFIVNLLKIRDSAPLAVRQTVDSHIAIINGAFDAVLKSGPTNVHDQSFRSYKALQVQFTGLVHTISRFLDRATQDDILTNLESDLKSYSRSLNDNFSRDPGHSGLSPPEMLRIRTRAYTACCDLIHQTRALNVFATDFARLIESVREFQNALRDVLVKFNITTSFLVTVDFPLGDPPVEIQEIPEPEAEPEAEFEFDTGLGLLEFIEMCRGNQDPIGRHCQNWGRCFDILKSKSELLIASYEQSFGTQFKALENLGSDQKVQLATFRKWIIDVIRIFDEFYNCDSESEASLFGLAVQYCRDSRDSSASLRDRVDSLTQELKMRDQTIEEMRARLSSFEEAGSGQEAEIQQLKDREATLASIFRTTPESLIESAGLVAHEHSIARERLREIGNGKNLPELVNGVSASYTEARDFLVSATNGSLNDSLVGMARALAENVQNEETIRVILHQISPIREPDSFFEHAEMCVRQYQSVLVQNQELLDGFASILSVIRPKERSAREVSTAAIDSVKDFADQSRGFAAFVRQSLVDILGDNGEDVPQLLARLIVQMKANNESLASLQRLASDTEMSLMQYLEVARLKKGTHEAVRFMLRQLDARRDDATAMQSINARVSEILRIKRAESDIPKQIMNSLNEIAARLAAQEAGIKSLASKVLRCFDVTSMDVTTLLGKLERAMVDDGQPKDLDELFGPIFDLIPLTTRSDYRQYIPEICKSFVSLHESVMVMKPFASTLNNIFTQFDCKFASFTPGSKTQQFLKSQIYALHESLNRLVPSKLNSLIFLVLSRFVALLSSFMSALAAAALVTQDEKTRAQFFESEVAAAPRIL
jgi:hypothetical protein